MRFIIHHLRILFAFGFCFIAAIVQAAPNNTSVNFFRGSSLNEGYYPGEYVDARTGSLYWEVTDITLPGQGGFDINIVRSFNKNGPERLAMGNWELEIPRVTAEVDRLAYKYTKKGHTLCDKAQLLIENGKGMQLRIPGQRPRDLLIRLASSPHPKRAKFVTNDHWLAYCQTRYLNNKLLYKTTVSAFVVESPSGKKYIMDHISQNESGRNPKVTYYASEVNDRHGHWLKYAYYYSAIEKRDDRGMGIVKYYQPKPSLYKITAKDGRIVTFAYKYERPGFDQPFLLPRLVQITANGTSWNYETRFNSRLGLHELIKVKLPDASEWQYSYSNVIGSTLKKVVTPANAQIDYGYREISSRYFEGKGGLNAFDVAAVATRNIQGPYLKATRWRYSYSIDSPSQESVTRVNWGEKRQVEYRFKRGNMTDWNLGLPTLAKVIDLQSGRVQREESWQWHKPTPIGSQWVKKVFHMSSAEHPQILSRHDIDGHVTTFSDFDDYGFPRQREEKGTSLRKYNYRYRSPGTLWLLGQIESEVLEGIGEKSYEYDGIGNLVTKTEYGQSTYFDYDVFGNVSEKRWFKDGVELRENYESYYRGKPRLVKRPESTVEKQALSQWALPKTKTNARGYTTEYEYDALNRINEIKPPIQAKTSYSYPDHRSTVVKTGHYEQKRFTDVLGHQVLKRSIDSVTGEQHQQKSEYDVLGRKVFESQRSYERHEIKGRRTQYDAINRPIKVTNTADGSKIEYCYKNCVLPDGVQVNSLVYEVKNDARGYKRVLEYETYANPDKKYLIAIHEQVKQSPNKFRVTRIKRNLLGKVLEIKQGSVIRVYTYNAQQRLATEHHPEVGLIEYDYDEVGNRVLKRTGGVETKYHYDGLNRLVRTEYGDTLTQTRQYDGNGNLISLTQTSEGKETQWHYQYNAKDQLISETLTYDGKIYTLGYTYNSLGQKVNELLLGEQIVGYQYDAFGRVTSIDNLLNKVTYYPNGGVKEIHYPDGSFRRVQQNARMLPSQIQYAADSQPMLDIAYEYDANGNLEAAINTLVPEETLTLAYDGISRLTHADGRWGLGHITYDEQDNIKSYQLGNEFKNYIYDAKNRLAQVETSTFSPVLTISSASVDNMAYDNFGNLTKNASAEYKFNPANQMVNAEAEEQHTFAYDGHGHRVEKITGENKENSLYDLSGTLRLKITDDGPEFYVRLKHEAIAKLKQDEIIYYQNDLLGSPKLAINQAGEIKWRQNYSPYGLELLEVSSKGSQGFTGHQYDKALGLNYMKARYYDPSLGRFLSIDPAAPVAKTPATFNRYSYAANNPYKYVDPDGEHPAVFAMYAIAALGGFITGLETYQTLESTQSYKEATKSALVGFGWTGVGVITAGAGISFAPLISGMISLTSSMLGTMAAGGDKTDMMLSGTIGFGFGVLAGNSAFAESVGKSLSGLLIGASSSMASQSVEIVANEEKSFKEDMNYLAIVGSGLGGKYASSLAKGAGVGTQSEIATFGRSTIASTVPSVIGEKLGE